MNKELEKLIEIKKELGERIDKADEQGDLLRCDKLYKEYCKINDKIREIATEEEFEELHIKGLI